MYLPEFPGTRDSEAGGMRGLYLSSWGREGEKGTRGNERVLGQVNAPLPE